MGSAVVVDAPTDAEYLAFEAEHLATLQDAAMVGTQALQTAWKAIPVSAHKRPFWNTHSAKLKAAAETADQSGTVIDAEPVAEPVA